MSDTPNLSLPLVAASQAQKHITVNEALTKLDALANPSVISMDLATPPIGADGDAYIIGAGATGVWAGRDRELAYWVNDGWNFAAPKPGWRVWVQDLNAEAIYAGGAWIANLAGPTISGAYGAVAMTVGDVTLSGASTASAFVISDRAVVIGVTGRVISAVSGAGVTGWRLGVSGAEDRYGSGIGLQLNSVVNGITGAPVGYYSDTPLQITAEGGVFAGGVVRLAIHHISLTPPAAV